MADPLEPTHTPSIGMLRELLAYDGEGAVRLTEWEIDFLDDVNKTLEEGRFSAPSAGQADKIIQIWGQVFDA